MVREVDHMCSWELAESVTLDSPVVGTPGMVPPVDTTRLTCPNPGHCCWAAQCPRASLKGPHRHPPRQLHPHHTETT